MSVIAVIPARAGSKRLPRKNMADLGGVPLIHWTIAAALSTRRFSKVIITTDDLDVMRYCRRGFQWPERYPDVNSDVMCVHERPRELATDEARTVDVMLDAYQRFKETTTAVVLLEPTTPFRNANDISECLNLLAIPGTDSVVSVTRFSFPPQHGLWVEDGTATEFFPSALLARGDTRTQTQRPVYHPNGGVYAVNATHFEKTRSLFRGKLRVHIMPREYSVDIDEQADLDYARFLVDSKRVVLWD